MITPTGIETEDGVHREYDTIVTATGFDTSYTPRIPISKRIFRDSPLGTVAHQLLQLDGTARTSRTSGRTSRRTT